MRRFTAFAIVGAFIAIAPAVAQQAGTRTADENPRGRVEAPARGCGFLGIYPIDVTRRGAEKLGVAAGRGAQVAGIVRETGAARAGIRNSDVITAFNGEAITGEAQLRRLIMAQTPGSWVRIDLVRNGAAMTLNAEISSRARYFRGVECDAPGTEERLEERRRDAVKDIDLSVLERGVEMRDAERELARAHARLSRSVDELRTRRELARGYDATTGMALDGMSPQLAKYFNTGTGTGALVSEVADASPAKRAGMQAGDVVIAVNGVDVQGPMGAVETILGDRDGVIELTVVRDAERRTVLIRTAAPEPDQAPMQIAPRPAPNAAPDLGTRSEPELIRLVGGGDLQ